MNESRDPAHAEVVYVDEGGLNPYDERWIAMEKKFKIQEERLANMEQKMSSVSPLIGNQESPTSSSDVSEYTLDEDTYALMVCSRPCSRSWFYCVSVFLFQIVLMAIILYDQLFEASLTNVSNLEFKVELPYSVSFSVYIGQFLAIITTLLCQTDLFEALKTIMVLFNLQQDKWLEVINEPSGHTTRFPRILFPYACKFFGGTLVLISSCIIVITSDNIIDLFKDFAALQVISFIDDVAFVLAKNGYLGNTIAKEAKRATELEMKDHYSKICGCFPFHSLITFFIFLGMIVAWLYMLYCQATGILFAQQFPNCDIEFSEISRIGDGHCDGGVFNSLQCNFDGADCVSFNLAFPSCETTSQELLGDGYCHEELNTQECEYDGGDCCPYKEDDPLLGDGTCHGGWYNTEACNFDGGDCDSFNKEYPNCFIDLAKINADDHPVALGDDVCDGMFYNTANCGYEQSDCDECRNIVQDYDLVGNGNCNGKAYNSEVCNYDGGDCVACNKIVEDTTLIGDGTCNGGLYNSKECNFDGNDCRVCNRVVDDFGRIGDSNCDGGQYNSEKCGYDGGDCNECNEQVKLLDGLSKNNIGNGICDKAILEIKECNFDGLDCIGASESKDQCESLVDDFGLVGDGYCDGGQYNTEACRYDGGDCAACNRLVSQLGDAYSISNVGNGKCDEPILQIEQCNLDGNDCDTNKCKNSVEDYGLVGDGYCDGGSYNTEACRYDGGDCAVCNRLVSQLGDDYSISNIGNGKCDESILQIEQCNLDGNDCSTNRCDVDDYGMVGNGNCDGGAYNTEACDYDGGDCNECNKLVGTLDNVDISRIGDGTCDTEIYQFTEQCNLDGGDCKNL